MEPESTTPIGPQSPSFASYIRWSLKKCASASGLSLKMMRRRTITSPGCTNGLAGARRREPLSYSNHHQPTKEHGKYYAESDMGNYDSLVGAIVGAFVAAMFAIGFSLWSEDQKREREVRIFLLNRAVQLLDDLNRIFYAARTETAHLIDALELLPPSLNSETQSKVLINAAVNSLKNYEGQAHADLAQLKDLVSPGIFAKLTQILSLLAKKYDYNIKTCTERIALYQELEEPFATIRNTVMNDVVYRARQSVLEEMVASLDPPNE
jgi:hypothetical protein